MIRIKELQIIGQIYGVNENGLKYRLITIITSAISCLSGYFLFNHKFLYGGIAFVVALIVLSPIIFNAAFLVDIEEQDIIFKIIDEESMHIVFPKDEEVFSVLLDDLTIKIIICEEHPEKNSIIIMAPYYIFNEHITRKLRIMMEIDNEDRIKLFALIMNKTYEELKKEEEAVGLVFDEKGE